jgi:nitrate/TMAO reductase-like tetraheme cytochrome c subunit
MIKVYTIILSLFLFTFNLINDKSNHIYIFYTSNINGSWEDCGCYGYKMGGLARVKTVVDEYREKNQNVYLIDTGDSFTSFDYPEKNKAMLELMREIGYDFIPQADQELATNSISHINFNTKHELFDFYLSPEVFKTDSSNKKFYHNISSLSNSPFLIFHGDSTSFIKGKSYFKEKKYIFLSHSHDYINSKVGSHILMQAGFDLEFLGLLTLDENYNFINNKLIQLDTTIIENSEVLRKIDSFYDKNLNTNPVLINKTGIFKSIDNCKQCHETEFSLWEKTNHAHAFNTLKEVNRAFDKSCLSCHTTGFEKGGFTSFEKSAQFINVQCESCHADLSNDHQLAEKRLTRHKVDDSTCISCHTKENSPNFNYSVYLEKIKHWNKN